MWFLSVTYKAEIMLIVLIPPSADYCFNYLIDYLVYENSLYFTRASHCKSQPPHILIFKNTAHVITGM